MLFFKDSDRYVFFGQDLPGMNLSYKILMKVDLQGEKQGWIEDLRRSEVGGRVERMSLGE